MLRPVGIHDIRFLRDMLRHAYYARWGNEADVPLERYVAESKRLIGVMETRLAGRQWIMDDDYTIADIASLGWVRNLIGFYGARELVGFDEFRNVAAWLERGLVRPAVQRGLNIPPRP